MPGSGRGVGEARHFNRRDWQTDHRARLLGVGKSTAAAALAVWLELPYAPTDSIYAWARADTIVWLDFPLPIVVARVARRNFGWRLAGATVWGGQRMSFRKAQDGALHSLKSRALKRRAYGWLGSLVAPSVVRAPRALARWLETDVRRARPA